MNKKLWHILMLLAFDFALLVLISSANAQALHLGHSGERVLIIQRQLSESGFFSGKANGEYGLDTRKSIKKFQRENGLDSSGETDYETLNALGISSRTAPCFSLEAELLARCIQESGCITYSEMLEKGIEILEETREINTLGSYVTANFPDMNYMKEPACAAYSAAVQALGLFSQQAYGLF